VPDGDSWWKKTGTKIANAMGNGEGFSFTPACNAHDICCERGAHSGGRPSARSCRAGARADVTCGTSRDTCDTNLKNNMFKIW
jgi:hypothetical protein